MDVVDMDIAWRAVACDEFGLPAESKSDEGSVALLE